MLLSYNLFNRKKYSKVNCGVNVCFLANFRFCMASPRFANMRTCYVTCYYLHMISNLLIVNTLPSKSIRSFVYSIFTNFNIFIKLKLKRILVFQCYLEDSWYLRLNISYFFGTLH